MPFCVSRKLTFSDFINKAEIEAHILVDMKINKLHSLINAPTIIQIAAAICIIASAIMQISAAIIQSGAAIIIIVPAIMLIAGITYVLMIGR